MYGHLWMDQGCQGNCVIHGYSDRMVSSVCMAIHRWTRDVGVTVSSTDALTGGRQAVCVWTRDVRVTLSSTDTLTGGRQGVYGYPQMDKGCQSSTDTLTGGRQCVCDHPWMDQGYQGNCVIHGYSDRG